MAALTDDEKARVRYHLGYPLLTTAASVQFGQPALTQTSFMVDNALSRLTEPGLNYVRSMSKTMDDIEVKLIEAQDRLAAERLEDLYLRKDEVEALENEYRRWGRRLADTIGAPIYPYSARYQPSGSAVVTNVKVSG